MTAPPSPNCPINLCFSFSKVLVGSTCYTFINRGFSPVRGSRFSVVLEAWNNKETKSVIRLALERAEGSRCCAGSLHVLVHGAISGELGLSRCQLEVKVVDCEDDDDY